MSFINCFFPVFFQNFFQCFSFNFRIFPNLIYTLLIVLSRLLILAPLKPVVDSCLSVCNLDFFLYSEYVTNSFSYCSNHISFCFYDDLIIPFLPQSPPSSLLTTRFHSVSSLLFLIHCNNRVKSMLSPEISSIPWISKICFSDLPSR